MLHENVFDLLRIPVVFAVDDDYAQHCGVVIHSIIQNKQDSDRLQFYIIDCGISESNRMKFQSLVDGSDVALSFIPFDIKRFSDFVCIPSAMSKATYARYMIPELVQEDKVIYLDSDLIVRSSLRELYQEDIKEYYFAGCADFRWDKHIERLGLQKYCNAGVMLINVRRWREENIQEKLIKYTEKNPGKLLFNDQDVLNIVLQDCIKYLDKRWNALASRYAISEFSGLAETAFIIHFASPASEKPWMPGSKSPMKQEYFKYLRHTPWQSKDLIVSMTSYPARISGVSKVLEAILGQTLLPDEVILWLGADRFPNRLADLPEDLANLVREGKVTVRWCQDLGPHTKYFHAFKTYPDALVITADDDILYHETVIESLYQSYLQHPNAVSALGTRLIGLLEDGTFAPFEDWPLVYRWRGAPDDSLRPSMHLLAEGVDGCLYPTGLFESADDLLEVSAIQRTCPNNDDLWLKAMQLTAGVPVVVAAADFQGRNTVPGSQELGLWHYNLREGGTDYEWSLIQREIDRRYGKGTFIRKLAEPSVGRNFFSRNSLYHLLAGQKQDCDRVIRTVNRSLEKYRTFRVDIRNNGAEGSTVVDRSVSPVPSRLLRPAHIPNGMVIESTAGKMKVVVSAVGDGELDVRLIGRNERNAAGQRYPVWIDVRYFAVNGEVVFDEVKTVCFDRRYQYRRPVRDGETVMLEFAWSECQSSTVLDELRQLQSDLRETRLQLRKAVQDADSLRKENQLLKRPAIPS